MGSALSSVVFQPPRPPSYSNDANIVWITTSRGNEIPCFHCFRSKESFTILFSHGNAEDLGMIVNYFKEASAAWNVNIFAYEYTGYGLAGGIPSEANVYDDIEAAYRYLTVDSQIPPSKIVLYGRSLGSGPSVHLARNSNVRGLILQSGLASIMRVGLKFIPFTLPGDMFCNIDKIRDVECPVFFIHGIKDEIVPFHHSAVLYNACLTPVTPYWLADAGHNNVEIVGRQEFTYNIIRFLKGLASNPVPEVRHRRYSSKPKFAQYAQAKFSWTIRGLMSPSRLRGVEQRDLEHHKLINPYGRFRSPAVAAVPRTDLTAPSYRWSGSNVIAAPLLSNPVALSRAGGVGLLGRRPQVLQGARYAPSAASSHVASLQLPSTRRIAAGRGNTAFHSTGSSAEETAAVTPRSYATARGESSVEIGDATHLMWKLDAVEEDDCRVPKDDCRVPEAMNQKTTTGALDASVGSPLARIQERDKEQVAQRGRRWRRRHQHTAVDRRPMAIVPDTDHKGKGTEVTPGRAVGKPQRRRSTSSNSDPGIPLGAAAAAAVSGQYFSNVASPIMGSRRARQGRHENRRLHPLGTETPSGVIIAPPAFKDIASLPSTLKPPPLITSHDFYSYPKPP